MIMLIVAAICFVIAALLGVVLLSYVLRSRETPKALAIFHGPIAATGLILLIVYAVLYQPSPVISIILFALTALGGFFLIYKDLTGRPLPKWLALGHGFLAIIAFISLLVFMFVK